MTGLFKPQPEGSRLYLEAALLVGICLGAAGLAVIVIGKRAAGQSRVKPLSSKVQGFDVVILMQDGIVIDHSKDAGLLFVEALAPGAPWSDIRDMFEPVFGPLPDQIPETPATLVSAPNPNLQLQIVPDGAQVRIALDASDGVPLSANVLHKTFSAHQPLQDIVDNAIGPIWQTGEKNRLLWANPAYHKLASQCPPRENGEALFDLPPAQPDGTSSTRASVKTTVGDTRWFEVTRRTIDGKTLHYASSIESLVMAEMAQRNFVQTLTKTFAHLPIGLAVFDKERRLVLFNPALVDLTHLPVEFLSARPNLLSFFDHMRENRMMPEPKNYANWRDQLGEVISAARDDRYCETWSLPSGLTYKITGRPHPDGAVAFLLEDISAEISLTRRFRSELELTQSVLDSFDDAIAVFSQLGVLTFCNAAYRRLWNCDPDSAFAEMTIVDATQAWQQGCDASPIWPELRDFVLTLRDRAAWDAPLTTKAGKELMCIVEPVAAGATLVRFSPARENAGVSSAQTANVD